jgi:hypothetical protein
LLGSDAQSLASTCSAKRASPSLTPCGSKPGGIMTMHPERLDAVALGGPCEVRHALGTAERTGVDERQAEFHAITPSDT